MTRFLVAAVADLGHRELALESAPDPIVNTLGFPPCLLDTLVAVRLVTLEWLGAFFYDWRLDGHGENLAEVKGTSFVDVRGRAMFRQLGSKQVSTRVYTTLLPRPPR